MINATAPIDAPTAAPIVVPFAVDLPGVDEMIAELEGRPELTGAGPTLETGS